MTADTATAAPAITRLRLATGALTVLTVVSFIAVGAYASVVLFVVVGGALTALLAPGRTIVTALAGAFGVVVAVLAGMYLAGGAPEEWGDQLFVYGGGLLGIAVAVLAGLALARKG